MNKVFPLFAGDHNESPSLVGIPWFDELSQSMFNTFFSEEYYAACGFLTTLNAIPNTFKSYRRDVERFLLWCWVEKQKSCLNMRQSDALEFIKFIESPPAEWIGQNVSLRFKNSDPHAGFDPLWRPIDISRRKMSLGKNGMAKSSKALTYGALSSFFRYLIEDAELTEMNPFLFSRKRGLGRVNRKESIEERLITDLQMKYIVEASKKEIGESSLIYARKRFLVAALYYLGVRISEISERETENNIVYTPTMGDFVNFQQKWLFSIPDGTAKGGKGRKIPVGSILVDEIKLYRTVLQEHVGFTITTLPSHNDPMPIFPKISVKGQIMGAIGARQLSKDLKAILGVAQVLMETEAVMAKENGDIESSEYLLRDASGLMAISPHWLRHKGASDDINAGVNPNIVKDNYGHSDLATTSIYSHVDLLERVEAADTKKQY